jgi:peroxiredoxin Q/BCP
MPTPKAPSASKVQVWVHGLGPKGQRQALLLKPQPHRGDFWQPITGGVESNELVPRAAVRELGEETGFDGAVFPLDYAFHFQRKPFQGEGLEDDEETVFEHPRIEPVDALPVRLDAREHQAFEWVDFDQVPKRLKYESNREGFARLKRRAPDFVAIDQDAQPWRLGEAVLKRPVLLVFYPGDFTPVCTMQLCQYRDSYSEFENLGVEVVGVSSDSAEKHRDFRAKHKLPFRLLVDPQQRLFRAFGIQSKLLFGMPTRGLALVGTDRNLLWKDTELAPVTFTGVSAIRTAIQIALSGSKAR